MNSILYRAETRLTEDFSSLLIFELFNFLENENEKKSSSFYEYIQKRISAITNLENLNLDSDIKNINENEFKEIAEKSIDSLKNVVMNIKESTEIQLGLNLKKKSVEKELKKLFAIQKKKKYIIYHSEFFNSLQEVIKNIKINKDDLSCPPINMNINKIEEQPKTEIITEEKNSDDGINIIEQLDKFINDTFREIDPRNELKDFKISLQSLRENILGRKIRISFIGNISVGKSSVLNCIIGQNILPTKDSECTYRGVILRHKEDNNYKLYRTKLITRGEGLDEYYYFEDEPKWHCNGILKIKDYLNNKNNDKNIGDEDAYIVITGRLKIFDFIKLDKKIINKIEFVDLPGPDRKNNTFNDKKYYLKILKFSNCCIYINEPKTIDDKESVKRMLDQYTSDKSKVFGTLRKNFIKTCLFLINKSDTLQNENEKKEIIKSLVKTIKKEEKELKENEMNISFFSGKFFSYFLDIYNQYVTKLEKEPFILLEKLYKDWGDTFTLSRFKNFIIKKVESLQEKFDLDTEEEFESNEDFQKKFSLAMDKLFEEKYRATTEDEEEEIREKLYTICHQLKVTNFDETKFSHLFFNKLKEVITYSDQFQNQNMKYSIQQFFTYTDQLFEREISKENEQDKKQRIENYNLLQNEIIPKVSSLFEEKKKIIADIYDLGLYRCKGIIDEEIKNADNIIKEANDDIEIVAKNLEEKIDNSIKEVNTKKSAEWDKMEAEIKNIYDSTFKKFCSQKKIDSTKIDTNKGITFKMFASIIGSTISGIAVRSGLVMVGESLISGAATAAAITNSTAIGTALIGPTGMAIGFGVGVVLSVGTLLVHYLSKSKRYVNGLEQTKIDIEKKFEELKEAFLNDFSTYQNSFQKDINLRLGIMKASIDTVDEDKWKQIKKNYQLQKKNIEERIKSFK